MIIYSDIFCIYSVITGICRKSKKTVSAGIVSNVGNVGKNTIHQQQTNIYYYSTYYGICQSIISTLTIIASYNGIYWHKLLSAKTALYTNNINVICAAWYPWNKRQCAHYVPPYNFSSAMQHYAKSFQLFLKKMQIITIL